MSLCIVLCFIFGAGVGRARVGFSCSRTLLNPQFLFGSTFQADRLQKASEGVDEEAPR